MTVSNPLKTYIEQALAEKIRDEDPLLSDKSQDEVIAQWDPTRTFISVKDVWQRAQELYRQNEKSERRGTPSYVHVANEVRKQRKRRLQEKEKEEKEEAKENFNSDREQGMLEAAKRLLDEAEDIQKACGALVKVGASIPQRKRPKPLLIYVRRALLDLLEPNALRILNKKQDAARADEVMTEVIAQWDPTRTFISVENVHKKAKELWEQDNPPQTAASKGNAPVKDKPALSYVHKVISEIKAEKNDQEKRMISAARDLLEKSGNSFNQASWALLSVAARWWRQDMV